MIKIDISLAISLYLLFTVIIVLIAWSFYEYHWKIKKYSSDKRFIWQCSVCCYTYIDSTHDAYSVCPQCASYNERKADIASKKGKSVQT